MILLFACIVLHIELGLLLALIGACLRSVINCFTLVLSCPNMLKVCAISSVLAEDQEIKIDSHHVTTFMCTCLRGNYK